MTSPVPQPTPPQPQKRLTRSRDERMLAGVCGGLADYLGVDPTIVRLVAVLLGIVSVGTAVVGYVIAAVIIPEASDGS
jgi:phage shock protein C